MFFKRNSRQLHVTPTASPSAGGRVREQRREKMTFYTLTTSFDNIDGIEIDVRYTYTIQPGQEARTNCLPEDATPYEPPEIEIIDVEIYFPVLGKDHSEWVKCDDDEAAHYIELSDDLDDKFLENANKEQDQ